MIYFGIPLRSKAVSRNWENICYLFNRTLHSIYSQTDPDFKVFVACHDIPEVTFPIDERVQFLISETPIPKTHYEMMLDKGWKDSMIGEAVRQAGGGYTMIVDADDIVSNRIAEYVNSHPNRNGFLSRHGYVYNEGTSFVKKLLSMHRICGSCSIVYYRPEDLPDHMPKDLWDESLDSVYVLRMSHRIIPDYLEKHGKPLAEIPFPTTIYVRNTGDNHSMMTGTDLNWKRKIEMLIGRRYSLKGKLGSEFGFTDQWAIK